MGIPTEVLKNTESNSDSVAEIDAMRKDSDTRLQEASSIAIDTKLINAKT